MDTFKVQVLTPINQREGHIIRAILSDETYRQLVSLSEACHQPISQLASKAVDYALANLELVEM